MNTTLLTNFDLKSYIERTVPKQRVESFFSLGISVSRIVGLSSGVPVVRAFSQLVEEWEYVHSGATMQGVKFVMAKNSNCIHPQPNHIESLSDLSRPSVYKFNNTIVYEHLQLPHIPFELDYVEVLYCLFIELSKLYEKFLHEDCYSNQVVYDTIVRLDTRVKHHVISMLSKEITDVCVNKTKSGTRGLRSLAGMRVTNQLQLGGSSSVGQQSNSSLSSAAQGPVVTIGIAPNDTTNGNANSTGSTTIVNNNSGETSSVAEPTVDENKTDASPLSSLHV
jgi:hypothetical protein